MGFFSHLLMFFHIKAHTTLDKAEDPAQIMDHTYQKQHTQLQQIRRAIVEVITNQKRLQLQQKQIVTKVSHLSAQARQALLANREDLARLALKRQEQLVPQLHNYEPQIAQLQGLAERLIAMERDTTSHIEALRTQQELIKTQYNIAQIQIKAHEINNNISDKMNEMHQTILKAQEKVLTIQARSQAMETLITQETVGDMPDREHQKTIAEQRIELQLQAMKELLYLGGPDTSSKQMKGPANTEF
jgi:phage shock protein A